MRFRPKTCPYPDCPTRSGGVFSHRLHGRYRRQCDGRLVQRFLCRECGRTFSVQSFRLDYRMKKPALLLQLFPLFVSKVTHRQSARVLGCTRRTVARRLGLLGSHAEGFHRRMLERKRRQKDLSGTFQLDELETFEHSRRLAPVTLPLLIARRSYFILDLGTAALPCRGRLSPAYRRKREQRELEIGVRKSGSREAVTACFETLARVYPPELPIRIQTDRKTDYAAILRQVFGSRVSHERHDSRRRRDYENPLFPINHTLAMARDGISRLVRRTWAASKLRERLRLHAWIWAAWRNYVRSITNEAPRVTAAMAAGVATRRWSIPKLCAWRVFA